MNKPFNMAYMDTCGPVTLLLIHGFPLNNIMWSAQYDELYDIARIIAPDLPGHGLSDALPGTYTMELMAKQCYDLLQSLEITTPVIVGGLSMGGYVAFEFYRQYPQQVAGLILSSTRAAPDSPEAQSARNSAISGIKKKGVGALVDGMLPKLFAPQTYEENGELVDFVKEMMLGTKPEGAVGALRGMKERPDSRPTLGEIDVPTLIIHGGLDQIIPVAEAEEMQAAIDGSELYIVPDAGHLPNMEQPELFNEIVAEFIASL